MSYLNRLQETLTDAENTCGGFMLDQIAFTLNLAHRANILNVTPRVAELPKLRAQFEDCQRQESGPIHRAMALLSIAGDMNREDHLGRVSDLIRKYAQG